MGNVDITFLEDKILKGCNISGKKLYVMFV